MYVKPATSASQWIQSVKKKQSMTLTFEPHYNYKRRFEVTPGPVLTGVSSRLGRAFDRAVFRVITSRVASTSTAVGRGQRLGRTQITVQPVSCCRSSWPASPDRHSGGLTAMHRQTVRQTDSDSRLPIHQLFISSSNRAAHAQRVFRPPEFQDHSGNIRCHGNALRCSRRQLSSLISALIRCHIAAECKDRQMNETLFIVVVDPLV